MVARNWPAAPYLEISAARVQYTDQPAPSLVNRSADDYHLKTGVRWTLSPTVTATGWRFNERNTEDRFVPSYHSYFFDGGFIWQPSPAFLFQANVERFIGEPSMIFAVLAYVRRYPQRPPIFLFPG